MFKLLKQFDKNFSNVANDRILLVTQMPSQVQGKAGYLDRRGERY